MNHKNWLIGSHISLNKTNNYLLGVVKETIDNQANIFMIFTGPPQNKKRVNVNKLFLSEAKSLAKTNNIDFSHCVVHAPYIINLATNKQDNIQFNIDFLINEITRSVAIGIKLIVLHPGFHVNQTLDSGIQYIVDNLKIILEKTKDLDFFICLETMAGKKNQIGKELSEIQKIIVGCENHKKLAVCLDTCHLHDAGYDLANKDKFLKEFDELIGIHRIKLIHLGDSMNSIGLKKDRHANLGYGYIGFETLMLWANDPYISTIPIIVETPYWIEMINSKKKLISPYKHEIQLIKNNIWKPIPYEKYLPIFNIHK